MVRRSPSLWSAARYALRHPVTALRLARADQSRTILLLGRATPAPIRNAVASGSLRLAEVFVRRPGGHAVAAPVVVLALEMRGDRAGALARASTLGTSAAPRVARRLARIALALGAPALSATLLDRVPAREEASEQALRGRVAASLGQYTDALRQLDAAIAGGDPSPIPLARRIRGELAVLDPDWRPQVSETPTHTRKAGRGGVAPGTIVHLLTNSLPYRQAGYTLRAQAVAVAQRQAGLHPEMVTRAGFPANEAIVTRARLDVVDGIRYHRIDPELEPEQPMDAIARATAGGLEQLGRELRAAALQPTTNYVNGQAALAAARNLGIPLVYEVRGFLEETWLSTFGSEAHSTGEKLDASTSERYLLTRAAETSCMARADAVVTLSETMRTDIIGRGIDPDRVRVIPNAVDVDRFLPGPRDATLAAQLGIDPDETVVGYISSLTPYEGVRYLIDAIALLVEAGQRVRLLVVGDGVERPALIAQAEANGLLRGSIAMLPGRVPFADIDRYYRLIDVFVVPRTRDRVSQLVTPLKPYEAMAMEKALVVSDVAALREIVTDGETGRIFAAEDPAALAAVIAGLVADPDERVRLGRAARAWVTANRTWRGNGERYLELYRSLGVA